jgi:Na+/proline symporter
MLPVALSMLLVPPSMLPVALSMLLVPPSMLPVALSMLLVPPSMLLVALSMLLVLSPSLLLVPPPSLLVLLLPQATRNRARAVPVSALVVTLYPFSWELSKRRGIVNQKLFDVVERPLRPMA